MNASDEAELNLQDVMGVLRQTKAYLLGFIVLATLGTFIASKLLPKKYDAIVVMSPVANSQTSGLLGGLTSAMSQFSGLASLAGLGQNTDSTKSESLAVLESEALTTQYIEQNNLLPELFWRDWDADKQAWKQSDPKKIPTLWKANQLFKKKIRVISNDTKSGMVTLTITWRDARLAAKWANDLVKLTNEWRRGNAIRESERNIAFLTTEVAKTDVVGVKQAVYSILQTEMSKMMLARGNDEYAIKVIDPAVPPEKAAFPLPLVWTLTALAVSVALSIGFVFYRATQRTTATNPG